MSADGKFVHVVERKPGERGADRVFWCPACRCGHGISVTPPFAIWTLSGPEDAPTIMPSVKTDNGDGGHVCHLTVSSGVIAYEGDCTHAMRGMRIPMERF